MCHEFQGQYKSTLVCPVCSKISITFDPFMYLSLPLPSTATRAMTITVFYGDGSGLPMPYTVTVLKDGACKDLCLALASACCLKDDECLLLAQVVFFQCLFFFSLFILKFTVHVLKLKIWYCNRQVHEHAIRRYLDVPLEPLSSIKDNEHIVAYRLHRKSAELTRLEICHRHLEK